MAVKRYKQRKSGFVAKIAVGGCAALALAACIGIGLGFASADNKTDVQSFGLDAASAASSTAHAQEAAPREAAAASTRDASALTSTAKRDISKGLKAIEAKEEADRLAAEQAARAEVEAHMAATAAKVAKQQATAPAAIDLSAVDRSIGKEAFIAEWGMRIDAYLAGSPLAGQGVTFATAAWNYDVDPRWSPAIANTESSKGAVCFLPHNAWGWGQVGFSNWEDAIDAHVAGLSKGYGYTISFAYAQKYCPPNPVHWFNETLSQMQMI